MSFTVLVSSAGRRVALVRGFQRALVEIAVEGRVLAADMSTQSAAFHTSDLGIVVPHCLDEQFIPSMLQLCARERVRLLVPTIDTELPTYAAHRGAFAEIGTQVLVSSPEVIALCADKRLTHTFLIQNDIPTVRQVTILAGEVGACDIPPPLVVKPASGSASKGVRIVKDALDLPGVVRDGSHVAQAVAPGHEYTIDAYVDDSGACRCAVPRRRIEVRAGEVSKAVTVRSAALTQIANRVVAALPGPRGVLTIQVFWDESSDEVNVIEINPRFGGGYPLSLAAGADFPRWLVESVLGREPAIGQEAWLDGLLMLRYDDAVYIQSAGDKPA